MPKAYQAKPQFPVTDPDPAPGTVFGNFSFGDLGFVAVAALGSGAVGYVAGRPRRNAQGIFFTILGGLGGIVAGYQSSHNRLTGMKR